MEFDGFNIEDNVLRAVTSEEDPVSETQTAVTELRITFQLCI